MYNGDWGQQRLQRTKHLCIIEAILFDKSRDEKILTDHSRSLSSVPQRIQTEKESPSDLLRTLGLSWEEVTIGPLPERVSVKLR